LAAPPSAEVSAAVSKLLRSAADEEGDADELEGKLAAIAAFGDPAIPLLAAALADPDENIRLTTVQALAKFDSPAVVDPLLTALKDESSDVRTEAVRALGKRRDRRAVPALLKQAQEDDTNSVRYACLMSLGLIGDPVAVPLLLNGTHDADPYVRMWSMIALCDMQQEQAPELVVSLVRDANVYVRRQLLVACEPALDSAAGHRALIDLALSADDFSTRVFAGGNLSNYRQRGEGSAELTEQVRRAARAALKNPAQTVNAALLLGELRDPAAVDGLIAALQSANYLLRVLAARRLGEIGDRRAVPALIKILGDPQEIVAAMAHKALQRFAQDGDAQAQAAVKNYKGKKFDQPLAR
jgi:HEAT repeat protein